MIPSVSTLECEEGETLKCKNWLLLLNTDITSARFLQLLGHRMKTNKSVAPKHDEKWDLATENISQFGAAVITTKYAPF